MTTQSPNSIDAVVDTMKACSGKLADHLRQQAALKAELSAAATDAQAGGMQEFADLFLEMAAVLGGTAAHNGKTPAVGTRRRGRPPKPADDQPATT